MNGRSDMSANIYWKPASPKGGHIIRVDAPSTFMEAMKRAFGSFPCTLEQNDVGKLEGMAAMLRSDIHNPYIELINLLDIHKTIDLWDQP
jgi:hypothetical protein